MAQLDRKFIKSNAVNGSKIRLDNNEQLRARNAANSADVNILKLNTSNVIEFASLPQASGTPSAANDLVNKAYLDAVQQGLKPKEAVRVATTDNITLANEQTVDGVALVAGDRVLVKNQTDAKDNGIYIVVDAGSWTRAVDFDAPSEINGAYTLVEQGTSAGKGFVVVQFSGLVGTDPINWVTFSSAIVYTAGDGLSLTGSEFSVNVDNSTIEINSDTLRVKDLGITAGKLAADSVTTAKILDANVTLAKLASNSVNENKLTTSVAGDGLSGGGGSALSVNVDDSTIEINSDTLRVKNLGISTAKLADDSVTNAKIADNAVESLQIAANAVITAKIADGNVTAAKLASDVAGSGLNSTSGVLSVDVAREAVTLVAGDITNQYVDLAAKYIPASIVLSVDGGTIQRANVDYTIDNTGSVTRIAFAGDLASSGDAALVAGDIIRVNGIVL